MTRIKVLFLLTLFLLFSTPSARSQVDQRKDYLISILNKLQEKFKYTFSYVDHELKNIQIISPSPTLDLEATLDYLRTTTVFDFTILNKSTIAISQRKKTLLICGVLVDPDANFITGATITAGTDTTISDKNGNFSIAIDKEETTITVQHLGFKSLKLPIEKFSGGNCSDIVLFPKVENLTKVFLTNYLIQGIDKNIDGSISIDYNKFGILPGLLEPDLLQTIQSLPGILSVNETVSDINVRGGTQDQNLILWDGIKIYQSSHFFGLISAFNPYLTKNVQVYKNGSRSQYGDGVSSVISMNTSNAINKKVHAGIGINLISVDGYIDTPLGKKSSIQLAARRSINDAIETWTYEEYFKKVFQDSEVFNTENSDVKFSFSDASFRWIYEISPKDLLKVNGLFMSNALVFEENLITDSINESKESSARQDNVAGGIFYKRTWSSLLESDILLYGTTYNFRAENADIINDQRLIQVNNVLENGLKTKTRYHIKPTYDIIAGYQFNETGISNDRDIDNPSDIEEIKEVIRSHGIFTEIEYASPNSATNLNIGGRLNYYEKLNRFLVEPRFSFQQKLPNYFTLEILGELKSQATAQIVDLQNDFLGVENRRWILSNEGETGLSDNFIPITQSAQISTGLSYKRKNWMINGEVYYKNVEGIITRSQGFQNEFETTRQQGSYRVVGLDFLINKRYKNLTTWLSYSYADNQYDFEELIPNRFYNNIDIKHNVNLAVSYTLEDFKFSSGLNWHTGKPFTPPLSENAILGDGTILYESPNLSRLEDYLRLDVSGTYTFKISKNLKALAGISIWNLLDQENISNIYYTAENNSINEVKEFGLGITPNAVVRITF